jgi:hypothetical protein
MIRGERSSSYDCEVSARVYRIAAMTVALDAGFSSRIRSYASKLEEIVTEPRRHLRGAAASIAKGAS